MDDTIVISYEFVLFRLKEFSAGNYPLSRQTSSISTEELGLCGEIPSLIFIRWKEGGEAEGIQCRELSPVPTNLQHQYRGTGTVW